ncbi:helix-turn-helix transcriptional regulator [Streptomyces sp. MUM 203J]|uniref:winged helix-turn-helix domain-containing protein n=1 Tax=Streptomyces sp. MUM 203J TaxID=2791990 RepID=UPI001F035032|nr:winged helix-turn-helix domain-containing protein [Streptomyces sp. MUM 203J]MCH0540509.1 helix-turn-helix transcriptional regulator [Streptomyces sp. MUM 203J]
MAENTPDPTPRPTPDTPYQLDPRSLRGLAHPLRMRLLRTLRHNGPATASQLADRFGESSGSTSYHLRQLAAYGFVEDDPERRGKGGRERWWRAVHQGVAVDGALHEDQSPETRGAMDVFLQEVAGMHHQELVTWLGDRAGWSTAWAKNADTSDFTLRLTPAQLGELNRALHAVVESFHSRVAAHGAEQAERVRVHLHTFPQRTDRED